MSPTKTKRQSFLCFVRISIPTSIKCSKFFLGTTLPAVPIIIFLSGMSYSDLKSLSTLARLYSSVSTPLLITIVLLLFLNCFLVALETQIIFLTELKPENLFKSSFKNKFFCIFLTCQITFKE